MSGRYEVKWQRQRVQLKVIIAKIAYNGLVFAESLCFLAACYQIFDGLVSQSGGWKPQLDA